MKTALSMARRQFTPLQKGQVSRHTELPQLRGIVFDVDGTLCLPQTYMFQEMRTALGISKDVDILDHCYSLEAHEQEEAFKKIRDIESIAMAAQIPQPGLNQLMDYLEQKEIPKAICTRNFDAPVMHLISKFMPNSSFAPIITRDFKPPKPSPAGILHIAKAWGFIKTNESGEDIANASNMIMVGDSLDDLTAGYRAGAATVLLANSVNEHLRSHEHCDLVIESLDKLIEILENGFTARVRNEE